MLHLSECQFYTFVPPMSVLWRTNGKASEVTAPRTILPAWFVRFYARWRQRIVYCSARKRNVTHKRGSRLTSTNRRCLRSSVAANGSCYARRRRSRRGFEVSPFRAPRTFTRCTKRGYLAPRFNESVPKGMALFSPICSARNGVMRLRCSLSLTNTNPVGNAWLTASHLNRLSRRSTRMLLVLHCSGPT